MIELRLQGSDDTIYIDFAYSGIPEILNIDKIVIRDEKINSISDDEETISKQMTENNDDSEFIEKDDDFIIHFHYFYNRYILLNSEEY